MDASWPGYANIFINWDGGRLWAYSTPLQGASNSTFAVIWPIVERVKDIFDSDYVVIQWGVDGFAGDTKNKVFNWSLSLEHEGPLGWCISRRTNDWNGTKFFWAVAGYNGPNAART
ncbi:hypothetical protein BDP27DRAFT_1406623 [Rhodocollybia butyracea]|uniref:Uncharacterized protein n=1 Tax=Rhodocollybia butyracea TaxID=206335 RepID=A0A9P5U0K7_9AGAR|nr:hypothetical protein BDP27DRAFT_1406623 [Rhodocollybia butyracea]